MNDLHFITPKNDKQMALYRKELEFLYSHMPRVAPEIDLDKLITDHLGNITVIFLDTMPVGCLLLEVYKETVGLHGIIRPDLKFILGRKEARACVTTIHTIILNEIFNGSKKRRIVAKFPPEAKGALGFVRAWGFERIPNLDKGRQVWKLTREKYLEGVRDGFSRRSDGKAVAR